MEVKQEVSEADAFMDLSAIGCSLLLDQLAGNVTVTMSEPAAAVNEQRSDMTNCNYLSPQQPPPPPYYAVASGLTPYHSPYVSPYVTPFHTPSPSPHSSVQSSPANNRVGDVLSVIPECDQYVWNAQQPLSTPAKVQPPPPPPYPQDRVIGRPPPRPATAMPYRTQLKQQLQRQQLEQQERRERQLAEQQRVTNALSAR